MNILFVHQNFPGQFMHLAPALGADPAHQVVALSLRNPRNMPGVRIVRYGLSQGTTKGIHPWVADMEAKVIRGEAAYRAALALRQEGFQPDLIMAHPGWGEALFLKEVWPSARLCIYCEFFYGLRGRDVGFDPEFPLDEANAAGRLRMKNANHLLHFDLADRGLAPTHWQKSVFPEPFRSRIEVVHDGINSDLLRPKPDAAIRLKNGLVLRAGEEIITFVNRNLEPSRGYHSFMRALPALLKARPRAQVVIIGGDQLSYGAAAPGERSWKQVFLEEVQDGLDMSRVHFVGKVAYPEFVALLQVSAVHVYLTYPFVLSWSMLEAMSLGCLVVGSRTAPVEEAIRDGENGLLVDFFSPEEIVAAACRVLEAPDRLRELRLRARQTVIDHYDLQRICLPRQLSLVRELAG